MPSLSRSISTFAILSIGQVKALSLLSPFVSKAAVSTGTELQTHSSLSSLLEQCFDVPSTICVGENLQAITLDATPKSLVGWWTFDESHPVDKSGYKNHMHPAPPVGPSFYGYGASAKMSEKVHMTVSHTPSLDTPTFSIAFWLYLTEDSTGSWRTIVSKGENSDELTPSVLLWPKQRQLHVRVSTTSKWNEGLDSKAVVPMRRWTHIAVTAEGSLLRLFVNGIKDSEAILSGKPVTNSGDLHVGRDAFRAGFGGFIDDIRFYNEALTEPAIQGFLAGSLTGISSYDVIHLGCLSCSWAQAMSLNFCPDTYHLCSLEELYSGGFHLARVQGWLSVSKDVWYRGAPQQRFGEKLGLCCQDLEGTEVQAM